MINQVLNIFFGGSASAGDSADSQQLDSYARERKKLPPSARKNAKTPRKAFVYASEAAIPARKRGRPRTKNLTDQEDNETFGSNGYMPSRSTGPTFGIDKGAWKSRKRRKRSTSDPGRLEDEDDEEEEPLDWMEQAIEDDTSEDTSSYEPSEDENRDKGDLLSKGRSRGRPPRSGSYEGVKNEKSQTPKNNRLIRNETRRPSLLQNHSEDRDRELLSASSAKRRSRRKKLIDVTKELVILLPGDDPLDYLDAINEEECNELRIYLDNETYIYPDSSFDIAPNTPAVSAASETKDTVYTPAYKLSNSEPERLQLEALLRLSTHHASARQLLSSRPNPSSESYPRRIRAAMGKKVLSSDRDTETEEQRWTLQAVQLLQNSTGNDRNQVKTTPFVTEGYEESYLDYDADSDDEAFVQAAECEVAELIEEYAHNPKSQHSLQTPSNSHSNGQRDRRSQNALLSRSDRGKSKQQIKLEIEKDTSKDSSNLSGKESVSLEQAKALFSLRLLELLMSRLERELKISRIYSYQYSGVDHGEDEETGNERLDLCTDEAKGVKETAREWSLCEKALSQLQTSSTLSSSFLTAAEAKKKFETATDADGFRGADLYLSRLLKADAASDSFACANSDSTSDLTPMGLTLSVEALSELVPFEKVLPLLLNSVYAYQTQVKQLRSAAKDCEGSSSLKLSTPMTQKINSLISSRVYQHWQRRRSNIFDSKAKMSLLRAHHSFMMGQWLPQENLQAPLAFDYTEDSLRDALKMLLQVRENLYRARVLQDRVVRRERLKRDMLRCSAEEWHSVRSGLNFPQEKSSEKPHQSGDTGRSGAGGGRTVGRVRDLINYQEAQQLKRHFAPEETQLSRSPPAAQALYSMLYQIPQSFLGSAADAEERRRSRRKDSVLSPSTDLSPHHSVVSSASGVCVDMESYCTENYDLMTYLPCEEVKLLTSVSVWVGDGNSYSHLDALPLTASLSLGLEDRSSSAAQTQTAAPKRMQSVADEETAVVASGHSSARDSSDFPKRRGRKPKHSREVEGPVASSEGKGKKRRYKTINSGYQRRKRNGRFNDSLQSPVLSAIQVENLRDSSGRFQSLGSPSTRSRIRPDRSFGSGSDKDGAKSGENSDHKQRVEKDLSPVSVIKPAASVQAPTLVSVSAPLLLTVSTASSTSTAGPGRLRRLMRARTAPVPSCSLRNLPASSSSSSSLRS